MMILTVTKEDIENGVRFESTECPVSLALSRKLGKMIIVEPGTWYGFGEAPNSLPRSVKRFVKSFDNGKPVKPDWFIFW